MPDLLAPHVAAALDAAALLRRSFAAAVAAADPLNVVAPALPKPPKGRTLVVGAGKAVAAMAKAVKTAWPAGAPLEGIVITRYGHGYEGEDALKRIRVVEAGHPVPDEAGAAAAREIVAAVQALGPDDLLLALFSGGGSSLFSLPMPPVSMEALKATTAELLKCGAAIQEINTVRKHLSLVQGGRLAMMCRAPIETILISDVVGDQPTHIASGPTVADPTTYQDALDILERYDCVVPLSVHALLEAGADGDAAETPKPGAAAFAKARTRIVATARQSLDAAAKLFTEAGVTPLILGDSVTGEAREVAKAHAAMVREAIAGQFSPFRPPVALLSGGECTVTVKNPKGRGGRCSEYLLSLAVELGEGVQVFALAADTDGIDGSEDNAGALLTPDTLVKAKAAGLRADQLLAANDAYSFFAATEGLVTTGPTRTNVNDYRAILVL
ncbi:MAG: glycerate kinase [Alphaproteobacteria bacterium]